MFRMEFSNKARLLFVFIQAYIVRSQAEDASFCERCSTEPTACRKVSGTFAITVMSKGYNPVVTVPLGACFLNVTERQRSENYLALKSTRSGYILNGMWKMNQPGTYHGAGTTFKYTRADGTCPGDCIYMKGPIREDLIVQLLYHNVSPGVDYSYEIPYYLEEASSAYKQDSQTNHDQDSKTDQDPTARNNTYTNNTATSQSGPIAHSHRSASEAQRITGPDRSALKDARSYFSPAQVQADVTQQQSMSTNHQGRRTEYEQSRRGADRRRRPVFSSDFTRSRSRTSRRKGPHRHRNSDRRQALRDRTYSINVDESSAHERPALTAALDPAANIIDVDSASTESVDSNDITIQGIEDYVWRASGYTTCSLSCGGGIKQLMLECLEVKTKAPVATSYCQGQIKPELMSVSCNQDPCLPDWEASQWSPCSTSCGQGQQARLVVCQQRISSSNILNLTEDQCLRRKPADTRPCQRASCYNWKKSAWGDCSVLCGTGVRTRHVYCQNEERQTVNDSFCSQSKPRSSRSCDLGSCARSWYYSNWNNLCSTDCGSGIMSRKVYCITDSGMVLADDQCDKTKKPTAEKACSQNIPCSGSWFTGPWSKCSVSCGEGMRQRSVLCIKKLSDGTLHVLDSSQCPENEKPASKEICSKDHCGTMWYMTEWSKCSVTCGGGIKHRHVQCLNREMEHSALCSQTERPAHRASCNEERCWTRPQPHNNGCVDRYPNCAVVVQTKLCRYPYYQRNCCRACSGWPS